MKSILSPTTVALLVTLSGAAFAADAPVVVAPAPGDPLTAVLVPIGSALNVVVQPVVVAPANAVTAIIVPPAAPAAPVVAKY